MKVVRIKMESCLSNSNKRNKREVSERSCKKEYHVHLHDNKNCHLKTTVNYNLTQKGFRKCSCPVPAQSALGLGPACY